MSSTKPEPIDPATVSQFTALITDDDLEKLNAHLLPSFTHVDKAFQDRHEDHKYTREMFVARLPTMIKYRPSGTNGSMSFVDLRRGYDRTINEFVYDRYDRAEAIVLAVRQNGVH